MNNPHPQQPPQYPGYPYPQQPQQPPQPPPQNNDLIIIQAIGELKVANQNIANSMNAIRDNLKVLNDHNILHAEKVDNHNQSMIERLDKYWWLIVALFAIILVIMGYKETIKYLIP